MEGEERRGTEEALSKGSAYGTATYVIDFAVCETKFSVKGNGGESQMQSFNE